MDINNLQQSLTQAFTKHTQALPKYTQALTKQTQALTKHVSKAYPEYTKTLTGYTQALTKHVPKSLTGYTQALTKHVPKTNQMLCNRSIPSQIISFATDPFGRRVRFCSTTNRVFSYIPLRRRSLTSKVYDMAFDLMQSPYFWGLVFLLYFVPSLRRYVNPYLRVSFVTGLLQSPGFWLFWAVMYLFPDLQRYLSVDAIIDLMQDPYMWGLMALLYYFRRRVRYYLAYSDRYLGYYFRQPLALIGSVLGLVTAPLSAILGGKRGSFGGKRKKGRR